MSLYGNPIFKFFYFYYEIHTEHTIIFFAVIDILYEIIILIKINYFITNEVFYFDHLFLWLNLINIVIYFCRFHTIIKNIEYYLIRYKNIKIEPYLINMKEYKKNQKRFISYIIDELKYDYLKEDLKVKNMINDFRKENNLTELKLKDNLPDFIVNEISEVFLFKYQQLFILSNNKYLLKYEFGKFINYFKNNNGDLNNILLKKEFNRINIVTIKDFQYIQLYED
jgi:hypothetical protein